MNGTSPETINVYGNSGEPPRTSVGVYSFPRDLQQVRGRITDVEENRTEVMQQLRSEGLDATEPVRFLPFYMHRYVLCMSDPGKSIVASVVVRDVDAILFASSLQQYLEKEFLQE